MRDTPTDHYSHYLFWEDWQNGLYGTAERYETAMQARDLLADPNRFSATLHNVAQDWPIATAQNLANVIRNHQPWCGRSAACYEHGATWKETNLGWWELTPDQRLVANEVADMFTYEWRRNHLPGQLGLFIV
jgi:NAD-dependent oxidoreductase involved in siderophore biosynthesis